MTSCIRRTAWLALLGVLVGLIAAPTRLVAEAKGPTKADAVVAKQVAQLMERGHIARRPVDDEISRRIFKAYLRLFDPLKLYFLADDVQALSRHAEVLDDDIRNGPELAFAFDVYRTYLARLDERVEWAHEFADADHDFNVEETMVVAPDAAQYAANQDESRERWRVRIKFELCSLLVDGKSIEEARDRIHKRYRNLKNRWHEIDNNELMEMYLSTLTSSYDPHSTYMSRDTLEDFEIHMRLSLEGIGALLQSEDGSTVVKEIVPGGAAEKDGRLKPGDQIVGVGEGPSGPMEEILEMKLRDVVKLIRGKAGTTVRLEVIPAGKTVHTTYELVRQKIDLKDQAASGRVVEYFDPVAAVARRIGVVSLPSFYADQSGGDFSALLDAGGAKTATNDVRRILREFRQNGGVDCVVMDLRDNGGGLLTEAINLTGLFIAEGPIVQVRGFDNQVQRYNDSDKSIAYDGPLVVLVNRFSASASEIFAGAIKDYERGIVVGDSTTHGKGTVQKVLDLGRQLRPNAGMGAVKLTMQQFYRVNGESTQNLGVPADVVLPSRTDHKDFGEASLDYALEFSTIQPVERQRFGMVDPQTLAELRAASKARFESDPALRALAEKKARFDERKGRKQIVFNEASLRAERAQLKGDEQAPEDEPDLPSRRKDEKFGEDPYTKEVLQIAADFLRIREAAVAAGNVRQR
jgi:carboxyl-terminal processing protease